MNRGLFHLLIDTTVDGATIGLSNGSSGQLICFENHPSVNHSSSSLNTLTAEILKRAEVGLENVNCIVVSQGPGSFTGIKVGLAFAYGLRHCRTGERKLIGYKPLEQMCATDHEARDWILGATRDRGAMAQKRSNGSVELCDFNLNLNYTWSMGGVVLVKSWPALEEKLSRSNVSCQVANLELVHQISMQVAALAGVNSKIQKDTPLPEPVYLRGSTAEEKIDGQKFN